MTDEEIKTRLLKAVYDTKKTKVLLGIDPYRLADDWGENKERVVSIAKRLKKEGLLKTETRAGVVYANEFAITTKGICEYEKVVDPIVSEPMNRGFSAKRGTERTPGYICKVLINADEYRLTVSAKETTVATYKEEEYKALCEKIARGTKKSDILNEIKDKWKCNDKNGFALVHRVREGQIIVTYGPSWEKPTGWTSKPKIIQDD